MLCDRLSNNGRNLVRSLQMQGSVSFYSLYGGVIVKLKETWMRYEDLTEFNFNSLSDTLKKSGKEIIFRPKQFIICRGEFPQYVYFIKSGTALGIKSFSDGNEFKYFEIGSNKGNVGLLEILARKEEYVASVMAITDVLVQRIESEIVYEYIMSDMNMLIRCVTLVSQDLYDRSAKDGIFYFMDGINRVRYYLVDYYNTNKQSGEKNLIVQTEYKDIAASVGISERTVGRSIQQLKRNGEILSDRKKVILTQRNYEILVSNLNV